MEVNEEKIEKCGICNNPIVGNGGSLVINTADGEVTMKLCATCYGELDMYIDMMESIDNETI